MIVNKETVVIYDSYGNPAFLVNTKNANIVVGDELWELGTPNGIHGWLKENKKQLVYESSTQTWKIEESSKSL